jgi:hypothetical protein
MRAFEIGFLLFLPAGVRGVIDLVVGLGADVDGHDDAAAGGLLSLPFKLIFFVLVDGWSTWSRARWCRASSEGSAADSRRPDQRLSWRHDPSQC